MEELDFVLYVYVFLRPPQWRDARCELAQWSAVCSAEEVNSMGGDLSAPDWVLWQPRFLLWFTRPLTYSSPSESILMPKALKQHKLKWKLSSMWKSTCEGRQPQTVRAESHLSLFLSLTSKFLQVFLQLLRFLRWQKDAAKTGHAPSWTSGLYLSKI